MFNIEFIVENFDDVLYDAKNYLIAALGKDISKMEKDCAMNKVIGMFEVLYQIVNITEVKDKDEEDGDK